MPQSLGGLGYARVELEGGQEVPGGVWNGVEWRVGEMTGNSWLDKRSVAKALGLSPRTIDAWIEQHRCPIPYYRIGGRRVLFRARDVERYIESRKVGPNA
jgi:excisionase family DNA binding protein